MRELKTQRQKDTDRSRDRNWDRGRKTKLEGKCCMLNIFQGNKIISLFGQLLKWWMFLCPKHKGIPWSWRKYIWIELLRRNVFTNIKEVDIAYNTHLTFFPCLGTWKRPGISLVGGHSRLKDGGCPWAWHNRETTAGNLMRAAIHSHMASFLNTFPCTIMTVKNLSGLYSLQAEMKILSQNFFFFWEIQSTKLGCWILEL